MFKFKKVLLAIGLILTGAAIMFAFNYLFLEHILIPDPCYYHNRDTTLLFDLFYDLPGYAGGHPTPTIFNLVFTLATGAILGWTIQKPLSKWRNRTYNSTQERFATRPANKG
jgi:hypothetical protein